MVHLVFLCAARGAGKTTACQSFVERARAADLRVGGILAPARYDVAGKKVGIDVVDAFSGEQRALGYIESDARLTTVGQYHFDPGVMNWALRCVLQALAAPIDVVVIDEIGPLELIKGEGLAPVFGRLQDAQAAVAVLIVRVELLDRLRARLEAFHPVTIMLTLANRQQLPVRLLEEVWEARSAAGDLDSRHTQEKPNEPTAWAGPW